MPVEQVALLVVVLEPSLAIAPDEAEVSDSGAHGEPFAAS